MEVIAKARFIRMSPRKVRLVAGLVRGMGVREAESQLKFFRKEAARPVLKLLQSAMANAEHNFKLVPDVLVISKITVDGGPTLKRWRPRAFGRAASIKKRSSHITIVLGERAGSAKDLDAAVVAKKDGAKKTVRKSAPKKAASTEDKTA